VSRISWSNNPSPYIDAIGHGTSVASVAAGASLGVVPGATIHSVRIDDGDEGAYASDIVDGLDYIGCCAIKPAVANLSYGGNPSEFIVANAIDGVIRSGVAVTKAAGNDNGDAFQDRGNRAAGSIIVGASTRYDSRATSSNYGSTVTLFAPGDGVRAADAGTSSGSRIVYGTSFAAPYTAGVVATLLQLTPNATGYAVHDVVVQSATSNALSGVGAGSPKLLLYSLLEGLTITGPGEVITRTARYTFTVSAPGFESRAIAIDGKYAHTSGGCPSRSSGGSTLTIALDPKS
jgi:subtilisin family serine protease